MSLSHQFLPEKSQPNAFVVIGHILSIVPCFRRRTTTGAHHIHDRLHWASSIGRMKLLRSKIHGRKISSVVHAKSF